MKKFEFPNSNNHNSKNPKVNYTVILLKCKFSVSNSLKHNLTDFNYDLQVTQKVIEDIKLIYRKHNMFFYI